MVCYKYLDEGDWLGRKYYTPEVIMSIRAMDDSLVNMVVEVDSGASISLLPRSAAEMVGVNFESGIPISLSGVGGSIFTAYVHTLDATVGDAQLNIPVAIAPTEDFPPLLGRLGTYDQSNILMDNDAKATCVGSVGTPLPPASGGFLGVAMGWETWVILGLAGLLGLVLFTRMK